MDHHQQLQPNITKWEILVLGGWGIWKKITKLEMWLWVASQKVDPGSVGVKRLNLENP